jgi:hypothetical protein
MKRALLLVLVAVIGACDTKQGSITGLGPYVFGHTTRGSIHNGVCQATDLNDGRKATWCFGLPPLKVGKRTAEVDAYFLGTSNDAPLIELQLKIRGCVEDEADQWMRERFGAPIATEHNKEFWKNDIFWAGAWLPNEPGRCIIHLLPLSENSEIDRLRHAEKG